MTATRLTIEGMQDMTFGMVGGSVESWRKIEQGVNETILRLQSGHGAIAISKAGETAQQIKANILPALDVIRQNPEGVKALRERLMKEFPNASRRAASHSARVSDLKQQRPQLLIERRATVKRIAEIDGQRAQLPVAPAVPPSRKPPPPPPPPVRSLEKDFSALDDAIDILDFLERGDRAFANADEMRKFMAKHPTLKSLRDAVYASPERADTLRNLVNSEMSGKSPVQRILTDRNSNANTTSNRVAQLESERRGIFDEKTVDIARRRKQNSDAWDRCSEACPSDGNNRNQCRFTCNDIHVPIGKALGEEHDKLMERVYEIDRELSSLR